MKKYILVIIGIFLLAGLVFATTNTNFLQGNYKNIGGNPDLNNNPGLNNSIQSTLDQGSLAGVGKSNDNIQDALSGQTDKTKGLPLPDVQINNPDTGGYQPKPEEEKKVLDGASTGPIKDTAAIESADDKKARDYINSIRTSQAISTIKDSDKQVSADSGIQGLGILIGNNSSTEIKSDSQDGPREQIASEFFVYLEVLDENGNFVSGLDESSFKSNKDYEDFTERTSFYSFEYAGGVNLKISLDISGYEMASTDQVTAVPTPRETEVIQLEKEAEPIACTSIEIQAYTGASLEAGEETRTSELGVTFTSNSDYYSRTIKVTNNNNTDFEYTESTYAHNQTTGEIQFFISNQKEGDIEFDATLTPGATFTVVAMDDESTCTDSFTVLQKENIQQTSAPLDTDFDGVPDESDNCPSTVNMDQSDVDGDGIGDICDPQNDSLPAAPEQDNSGQEEYYEVTPDVEQPEYETGEIFSCDHGFADIINTKNEATICWLAQEGVVNGKSETSFGYTENITVAEYLKVLLILAGESPSNGRSSFTDGRHWGEGWLVRAEELDVLRARDGFPANVNHPITRGDAALYAMRLIQETYYPTSSPYTDVQTDDYFGYAVIYLSDLSTNIPQEGTRNVLEGYEDTRYKPYAYINRGEAISLLSGMFFALFQ